MSRVVRIRVGKNKAGKMVVKKRTVTPKTIGKVVRGLSELKRYDIGQAYGNMPANAAPLIQDLLAPAQGLTDTNRIGDRLSLCGTMELRMLLDVIVTTADLQDTIMIFQWHPNTVPTINSVLLNGPTVALPESTSVTNMDTRQMYTILYRSTKTQVLATHTQRRYVDLKISLKKAQKQVQFVNGGTAATNKIYLMFFCDAPSNANQKYEWNSRIFYRDI